MFGSNLGWQQTDCLSRLQKTLVVCFWHSVNMALKARVIKIQDDIDDRHNCTCTVHRLQLRHLHNSNHIWCWRFLCCQCGKQKQSSFTSQFYLWNNDIRNSIELKTCSPYQYQYHCCQILTDHILPEHTSQIVFETPSLLMQWFLNTICSPTLLVVSNGGVDLPAHTHTPWLTSRQKRHWNNKVPTASYYIYDFYRQWSIYYTWSTERRNGCSIKVETKGWGSVITEALRRAKVFSIRWETLSILTFFFR